MTNQQKQQKLEQMKTDAREFQLRYAYLKLQLESIDEELKALKTLMQYGERKFAELKDASVEPDA